MAPGKLIVPDDVQGRYPTFRDAVLANTREARANDAVPRDIALAGGAQYVSTDYLARSATGRRLSRRAPRWSDRALQSRPPPQGLRRSRQGCKVMRTVGAEPPEYGPIGWSRVWHD
jgi:hypothetical protein